MPPAKNGKNRTTGIAGVLLKVVEAGLAGNRHQLELQALTAVRRLKKTEPELSSELAAVVARFSSGGAVLRKGNSPPPPTDPDEGLPLLKNEILEGRERPVLEPESDDAVSRFLAERQSSEKLLANGFPPPRSLLLKGAPGTGKTMLSRWIAGELGVDLVVLDLATCISSYLGKTGANLRKSLDYARSYPCVLLLDEFDAIAKRRDDPTDVGELKRIVNVLLKELEEWPLHSVLIAATNHPEMLDPAIERRFDVVIDLGMPGEDERRGIFAQALGVYSNEISVEYLEAFSAVLDGLSGSSISSLAQSAVRNFLVEGIPLEQSLVTELGSSKMAGAPKGALGQLARSLKASTKMPVRSIAELLGKSSTTIQYHLKKK